MGNELTIPMTRAERLLFEKLNSLEIKLDEIREERLFESIEEISIHKAAKLLHIGQSKILSLVQTGKLKAITYRDKEKKKHYRFRIADIREFQKGRSTNNIHAEFNNPDEIIKNIIRGESNV